MGYTLKQENQRLIEDNTLLKAENDRLVRMLYDKEREQQDKYFGDLDIKEKRIK